MRGYTLDTGKLYTHSRPTYLHYEDARVEIRSNEKQESVTSCALLEHTLPGDLSSYIYPANAIIYSKESLTFTEILELYVNDVQKYSCDARGVVFDVEPVHELWDDDDDEEYDSDIYDDHGDCDEEVDDDYDAEHDLEIVGET
jgi:hypothetical protein